jgi:hypothetical protein
MIKGTYIFYQDGREIFRSPNIVTKFGKRYFTRYLAGLIQNSAKDIAIGISDSKTVSSISGNGTLITYTTTVDHGLSVGNKVSIINVDPIVYNISDATIQTVPSSTTFTITGIETSAYVSGGNIVSDVDTRLGFEVYRTPVLLGSSDIQIENEAATYSIVYKATIPQDLAGVISEIGLYPSERMSANNYDSKFIADFDKYFDWKDLNNYIPSTSSVGSKFGGNVLTMQSNGSSSNEYTSAASLDIEGYSVQDTLSIAYYKSDINLNKITLKLYSSNSDYFYVDITPESGTGHKITSNIPLSSLFGNTVGSPVKSEISKIGIVIVPNASTTTSVGLDALRINDEDTFDPVFGLLSRSILSTPYLTKMAGRQIDIEYRLDLDF